MSAGSVFTLLVAAIFTCGSTPTTAQKNTGPSVLGIVEIPTLFGVSNVDPPTRTPPAGSVSIYRDTGGSIPLARIAAPADIEALEYDYEASGAVVYELARNAYRVRLSDGRYGWLRTSDAGSFHSLMSLYAESLTYLTGEWDGRVFETPPTSDTSSSRPGRFRRNDDETPVDVVEGKEDQAGRLWVRIEVLSSVCSAEEPRVLDRGWVPAHDAKGQLNVWFWSRGC